MKLTILLILILVLIPLSIACQSPLDNYAIEAVFNKQDISYNLNKINLLNSNFQQNSYILQSTANSNLALIFSKNSDLCDNCLSMRLQIPIEKSTSSIPYLNFVSSISGKKVNLTQNLQYYNGWIITDENSNLELQKDTINIKANFASNNYEFLVEISEKLPDCSNCNGKCLYSSFGNSCLDKNKLNDIGDVLKFLNIASSADYLLYSYKVIGLGEKTITDLVPTQNYNAINLKDAFFQDLNWAKKTGIISLSDSDINSITNLAEKGRAGTNQRIVYSQNAGKWVYYYELENATIIQDVICKEFPQSLIPQSNPSKITGSVISSYYLIPVASLIFLVILLVILIVIARLACRGKKTCDIYSK